MLIQRLFFGGLLIVGLVAIFWGDIHIANGANGLDSSSGLDRGSIIPLTVLLLTFFGALELLSLTRSAGYEPMAWVSVIGVVSLNGLAWLMPAVFADSRIGVLGCQLVVLVLAAMVIGVAQVFRRRTERGLGDIAMSIMILVYMGILPSFMTSLRASLPGSTGVWAILMFLAVVKCTDIGAYFTGIAWGKTKLIPSISPGKTVEGLAGGIILAIAVSLLLGRYLPWPEGAGGVLPISHLQAGLFGALMALLGQLGDLVESVFKRDAASKDSGQVIPAFGGILDLLDSPIFAAPVGYLLLNHWLG